MFHLILTMNYKKNIGIVWIIAIFMVESTNAQQTMLSPLFQSSYAQFIPKNFVVNFNETFIVPLTSIF